MKTIKNEFANASKNEQLSVSLICVWIGSDIFNCLNHFFFHTDSFIITTCVSLLIIYTLGASYFLIKGMKEKGSHDNEQVKKR